MAYEYKCVGAPERAKRVRGAKSRTDRVAHAMAEIINAEASQGWEYLRTDLVPVEEKAGIFSRAQEVHRAVLVFRKMKEGAVQPARPVLTTVPSEPEPILREEPLPTPEAEEPIRLAADADEKPAEPSRTLRAPSGLG